MVGTATMDRMFPMKLNLGNTPVLIVQSYNARAESRRSAALFKSHYSELEDPTTDKVMGGIVVCHKLDGKIESSARLGAEPGALT